MLMNKYHASFSAGGVLEFFFFFLGIPIVTSAEP